jgi:hypothetical protein
MQTERQPWSQRGELDQKGLMMRAPVCKLYFKAAAAGRWSFCLAVFQKVPNARKLLLVRATVCVGGAGVMARTRAVAAGGTIGVGDDRGLEMGAMVRDKAKKMVSLYTCYRYYTIHPQPSPELNPTSPACWFLSWQEANRGRQQSWARVVSLIHPFHWGKSAAAASALAPSGKRTYTAPSTFDCRARKYGDGYTPLTTLSYLTLPLLKARP